MIILFLILFLLPHISICEVPVVLYHIAQIDDAFNNYNAIDLAMHFADKAYVVFDSRGPIKMNKSDVENFFGRLFNNENINFQVVSTTTTGMESAVFYVGGPFTARTKNVTVEGKFEYMLLNGKIKRALFINKELRSLMGSSTIQKRENQEVVEQFVHKFNNYNTPALALLFSNTETEIEYGNEFHTFWLHEFESYVPDIEKFFNTLFFKQKRTFQIELLQTIQITETIWYSTGWLNQTIDEKELCGIFVILIANGEIKDCIISLPNKTNKDLSDNKENQLTIDRFLEVFNNNRPRTMHELYANRSALIEYGNDDVVHIRRRKNGRTFYVSHYEEFFLDHIKDFYDNLFSWNSGRPDFKATITDIVNVHNEIAVVSGLITEERMEGSFTHLIVEVTLFQGKIKRTIFGTKFVKLEPNVDIIKTFVSEFNKENATSVTELFWYEHSHIIVNWQVYILGSQNISSFFDRLFKYRPVKFTVIIEDTNFADPNTFYTGFFNAQTETEVIQGNVELRQYNGSLVTARFHSPMLAYMPYWREVSLGGGLAEPTNNDIVKILNNPFQSPDIDATLFGSKPVEVQFNNMTNTLTGYHEVANFLRRFRRPSQPSIRMNFTRNVTIDERTTLASGTFNIVTWLDSQGETAWNKGVIHRATFWNEGATLLHSSTSEGLECGKLGFVGFEGASGNCTNNFYKCDSGNAIKFSCPKGMFVDSENIRCEYKHLLPQCGGVRLVKALLEF